MKERQQSTTTYPLVFLLVSSTDHVSGVTGATVTVTLSKNGGSFASASGTVSEIGSGWYSLGGSGLATDLGTLGPLVLHATATGADPTDSLFTVVPWNPFDGTRLGLTALPNATAGANGGLPTGNASGQVSLNLSQTGLSPRALDAVADASLTVGDAMVSAISGAAGKETVSSTTYTIKTPSTGTVIRTFTLDSATVPTSRT